MTHLSKSKRLLLEMFGSTNTKLTDQQVDYLSDLIDYYPRKDVSLYVLRQYKLSLLYNHLYHSGSDVPLEKKEQKFFDTMFSRQLDQVRTFAEQDRVHDFARSFSSFEGILRHYYSLGISNIKNTELLFQAPHLVFDEFDQLEEDWKEKQSRILNLDLDDEYEEGELIHKFPNGMYIYDTKVAGCPDIGKASGHCGNGQGMAYQRLFVLMSPVNNEQTQWKTHVTFVLNNCEFDDDYNVTKCVVGEIKGYANEIPKKKYHQMLGEYFLEADFINGMGEDNHAYLPANNMQFSDFEEELQQRILAVKPNFISPIEKLVISKGNFDSSLINEFKDAIGDTKEQFFSLGGYAERFGLNNLERYSEDAYFDSEDFDKDEESSKSLLKKIMQIESNGKAIENWAITNGFYQSCSNLDANSIYDWAKSSGHEDFWIGLDAAVEAGHRAGAEIDLFNSKVATIEEHKSVLNIEHCGGIHEDIEIELSHEKLVSLLYERISNEAGNLLLSDSPMRLAYESEIYSYLKEDLENATEYAFEQIKDMQHLNDLQVSSYGFSGFDESVAIGSFIEHCDDVLDLNLIEDLKPSTVLDIYNSEVEKQKEESIKLNDSYNKVYTENIRHKLV